MPKPLELWCVGSCRVSIINSTLCFGYYPKALWVFWAAHRAFWAEGSDLDLSGESLDTCPCAPRRPEGPSPKWAQHTSKSQSGMAHMGRASTHIAWGSSKGHSTWLHCSCLLLWVHGSSAEMVRGARRGLTGAREHVHGGLLACCAGQSVRGSMCKAVVCK